MVWAQADEKAQVHHETSNRAMVSFLESTVLKYRKAAGFGRPHWRLLKASFDF